jgi:anthranilate synthase component 1
VTTVTGNQIRSDTHEIIRLSGDIDLRALARSNPARYPFLLQSSASGPELARYDMLFACPGETLELSAKGVLSGPHTQANSGFLGSLDSWWKSASEVTQDGSGKSTLPFTGGWFLYLGYELAQEVEPGLSLNADPSMPIAFATRIPVAIIIDRHEDAAFIVAEREQAGQIQEIEADLKNLHSDRTNKPRLLELLEDPADRFVEAVSLAQQYIRDGDIFQANLSRCWQAKFDGEVDAVSLYTQLCETNPAPFAGLVLHNDFALICSSPERLVKRRGRRIDTRPIAGTRPRNEPPEMMDARKLELLSHPKERAEHIMLIDLERNDLGRICVGGSILVDEHMVVESYSHVHHIVSNVSGTARSGLTPGELIRAVFPGGTITGCPKVRCMEIIHELEQRPRGAYTGSMGYLNLDGDCDLNILIRTMTARDDRVELAAGSGIVADSDPLAELDETRAKAKGLILALGANDLPG